MDDGTTISGLGFASIDNPTVTVTGTVNAERLAMSDHSWVHIQIVTNIALLLELIMVVAFMSALGATMSLPGLAGIALTVGMSVDANVLINERIREDLRLGLPPLTAISEGYRRATGTIVDAQGGALPGRRHGRLRGGDDDLELLVGADDVERFEEGVGDLLHAQSLLDAVYAAYAEEDADNGEMNRFLSSRRVPRRARHRRRSALGS